MQNKIIHKVLTTLIHLFTLLLFTTTAQAQVDIFSDEIYVGPNAFSDGRGYLAINQQGVLATFDNKSDAQAHGNIATIYNDSWYYWGSVGGQNNGAAAPVLFVQIFTKTNDGNTASTHITSAQFDTPTPNGHPNPDGDIDEPEGTTVSEADLNAIPEVNPEDFGFTCTNGDCVYTGDIKTPTQFFNLVDYYKEVEGRGWGVQVTDSFGNPYIQWNSNYVTENDEFYDDLGNLTPLASAAAYLLDMERFTGTVKQFWTNFIRLPGVIGPGGFGPDCASAAINLGFAPASVGCPQYTTSNGTYPSFAEINNILGDALENLARSAECEPLHTMADSYRAMLTHLQFAKEARNSTTGTYNGNTEAQWLQASETRYNNFHNHQTQAHNQALLWNPDHPANQQLTNEAKAALASVNIVRKLEQAGYGTATSPIPTNPDMVGSSLDADAMRIWLKGVIRNLQLPAIPPEPTSPAASRQNDNTTEHARAIGNIADQIRRCETVASIKDSFYIKTLPTLATEELHKAQQALLADNQPAENYTNNTPPCATCDSNIRNLDLIKHTDTPDGPTFQHVKTIQGPPTASDDLIVVYYDHPALQGLIDAYDNGNLEDGALDQAIKVTTAFNAANVVSLNGNLQLNINPTAPFDLTMFRQIARDLLADTQEISTEIKEIFTSEDQLFVETNGKLTANYFPKLSDWQLLYERAQLDSDLHPLNGQTRGYPIYKITTRRPADFQIRFEISPDLYGDTFRTVQDIKTGFILLSAELQQHINATTRFKSDIHLNTNTTDWTFTRLNDTQVASDNIVITPSNIPANGGLPSPKDAINQNLSNTRNNVICNSPSLTDATPELQNTIQTSFCNNLSTPVQLTPLILAGHGITPSNNPTYNEQGYLEADNTFSAQDLDYWHNQVGTISNTDIHDDLLESANAVLNACGNSNATQWLQQYFSQNIIYQQGAPLASEQAFAQLDAMQQQPAFNDVIDLFTNASYNYDTDELINLASQITTNSNYDSLAQIQQLIDHISATQWNNGNPVIMPDLSNFSQHLFNLGIDPTNPQSWEYFTQEIQQTITTISQHGNQINFSQDFEATFFVDMSWQADYWQLLIRKPYNALTFLDELTAMCETEVAITDLTNINTTLEQATANFDPANQFIIDHTVIPVPTIEQMLDEALADYLFSINTPICDATNPPSGNGPSLPTIEGTCIDPTLIKAKRLYYSVGLLNPDWSQNGGELPGNPLRSRMMIVYFPDTDPNPNIDTSIQTIADFRTSFENDTKEAFQLKLENLKLTGNIRIVSEGGKTALVTPNDTLDEDALKALVLKQWHDINTNHDCPAVDLNAPLVNGVRPIIDLQNYYTTEQIKINLNSDDIAEVEHDYGTAPSVDSQRYYDILQPTELGVGSYALGISHKTTAMNDFPLFEYNLAFMKGVLLHESTHVCQQEAAINLYGKGYRIYFHVRKTDKQDYEDWLEITNERKAWAKELDFAETVPLYPPIILQQVKAVCDQIHHCSQNNQLPNQSWDVKINPSGTIEWIDGIPDNPAGKGAALSGGAPLTQCKLDKWFEPWNTTLWNKVCN